ncbi:MAG: CHAT domain-containing protein [Gemmatimonadaceae bacterium]
MRKALTFVVPLALIAATWSEGRAARALATQNASRRQSPALQAAASARSIAAEAVRAASDSALAKWISPWQQRLRASPHDRSAMFAVAFANQLKYQFAIADSLYAQLITNANDQWTRQAVLLRAALRANRGQYALADTDLRDAELNARRASDTLALLDAILAHSGTLLRTKGAQAGLAKLAVGDSLGWSREPLLDAGSRCRLAGIHSQLGNPELARRLAREGIGIADRAQLRRLSATCQFILATDFARVGLTDSMRGSMHNAMDGQLRTGDFAGLAASKQWFGFYLFSLGRADLALKELAIAWSAAQRAGTVNTAGWIALNHAGIAQEYHDARENSLWLDRADSLMRATDDVQGILQVSQLLAFRALRSGDDIAADKFLHDAKRLADQLHEPTLQLSVSNALWEFAFDRGQLDDAEKWLEARRTLIDRYQMTGFASGQLSDEAQLALRRGNAQKALPMLNRTLQSFHSSQRKFIYETETEKALALAMSGDSRGAARSAQDAAETFDKWRSTLSDRSLRLFALQSQYDRGWFRSSLTASLASAGEVEVAFTLTERQRARDLRDRLALAAGDRASDSTISGGTVSRANRSVAELQRALPDNHTALVMMDAGEGGARGTAFVLTKESLTAHAMPTEREIQPRIRRLVALVESGRDAATESRALGASLIVPLLARLDSARVSRVVFLPEGVLHRLPFSVLRLPDDRFLIERFEIAVAPSATVLTTLVTSAKQSTASPRVLAFADAAPAKIRGDSAPESRLMTILFGSNPFFAKLAGARNEVASIERVFAGTVLQTGSHATETYVKQRASSFDVLHFATHAVVDEWSGATAALALSPTAADDGFLDSSEIAQMQLKASLVVLSACRTVGGEVIAGEGVRGLTSAFLQAGARSVIATGWRVNDRDVVPIVTSLYEQLSSGKPVGASLRSAQLDAIKRGVSPTAWGAFILVGDPWRAIASGSASRSTARE